MTGRTFKDRDAILSAASRQDGVSNAEVCALTRMNSHSTASRLCAMVDRGLLFKARATAQPSRWFTSQSGADAWKERQPKERPKPPKIPASERPANWTPPKRQHGSRTPQHIQDSIARAYQDYSNPELAKMFGVTLGAVERVAFARGLRKTIDAKRKSHAELKAAEQRRAYVAENMASMTPDDMAEHVGMTRKSVVGLMRKIRTQSGDHVPRRINHGHKKPSPAPDALRATVAAPKPIPQIVTEHSVEDGVKVTRARWVDHRWVDPSHVGEFTADWRNRRATQEQRA